ncbi:hypothetical protein [Streptomyces sp. NPDC053755]|uniref:hypothetical protein n=1 Tax=Streptomyces sp. NPDC053755 TaxID=3155815 RepID=UPI00344743C0
MQSAPEPELPDRVPASDDAVTPDLPPAGTGAPEIRVPKTGRPESEEPDQKEGEQEAGEERDGEGTPAGPGTPAPQEPTG